MDKYVSAKKASKIIGVHPRTLYNWEKKGKIKAIKTPGGMRLYNVNGFINENQVTKKEINVKELNTTKSKICYCRVSSIGQKNDLERQIEYMKKKYPTHIIIKDIGSGLNFNRLGIKKIIKMAINDEIDELVVAYKDRLTRFGYELIEDLIKNYSHGNIVVENKRDLDPNQELTEDLMQIMNVFIAKINGRRKYNKKHL